MAKTVKKQTKPRINVIRGRYNKLELIRYPAGGVSVSVLIAESAFTTELTEVGAYNLYRMLREQLYGK